jgi:hypothetical protein
MVATGLHQDPYPTELFYYRLADHAAFLTRLGISFESVIPLMSRDFTITFATDEACAKAGESLSAVLAPGGMPLFTVDNRGRTLFVMLTYPKEIRPGFIPTCAGNVLWDISGDVAFVALKNGEHNGIGYFLDTGGKGGPNAARFRLAELPERIMMALEVDRSFARVA